LDTEQRGEDENIPHGLSDRVIERWKIEEAHT